MHLLLSEWTDFLKAKLLFGETQVFTKLETESQPRSVLFLEVPVLASGSQ